MCDSSINALSTITCLEVALALPAPTRFGWVRVSEKGVV